jgi:hypothetical protein
MSAFAGGVTETRGCLPVELTVDQKKVLALKCNLGPQYSFPGSTSSSSDSELGPILIV